MSKYFQYKRDHFVDALIYRNLIDVSDKALVLEKLITEFEEYTKQNVIDAQDLSGLSDRVIGMASLREFGVVSTVEIIRAVKEYDKYIQEEDERVKKSYSKDKLGNKFIYMLTENLAPVFSNNEVTYLFISGTHHISWKRREGKSERRNLDKELNLAGSEDLSSNFLDVPLPYAVTFTFRNQGGEAYESLSVSQTKNNTYQYILDILRDSKIVKDSFLEKLPESIKENFTIKINKSDCYINRNLEEVIANIGILETEQMIKKIKFVRSDIEKGLEGPSSFRI